MQSQDEAQCTTYYEEAQLALDDPESEGAVGGRIVVTQPDPTVQVQQDAPEISVTQPDPQVSVNQPQPEIIVRQAQPTVTVQMPRPIITIDQPQPEIIVRMPDPQVNVTTPEPEIEVTQDQPEVTVRQGEPEVQVQQPEIVPGDEAEAQIEVEQNPAIVTQEETEGEAQVDIQQQQPNITYESAEPNVVFEETEEPEVRFTESGEPNIQVEQMDGAAMDAPEAAEGQQMADDANPYAGLTDTGAYPEAGEARPYNVADLTGRAVMNAEGEELGTVDRIATDGTRNYVVLAEGGFLGMGQREVALPLDSVSVISGQLVLRGMSPEDIDAMPEFDTAGAEPVGEEFQVDIGTIQ